MRIDTSTAAEVHPNLSTLLASRSGHATTILCLSHSKINFHTMNPTATTVQSAVDTAVQQGMLVRVTIVDAATRLDLHMLSGSTVRDLKLCLSERSKIPPGQMRLSVDNNHLLSGPLDRFGPECTVLMTHVPADPLLKSLLNHAGYTDWSERDECMAKMLTTRLPNKCFCGLAREDLPKYNTCECKQCNHHFWLFSRGDDSGWTPSSDFDPYAKLHEEALSIAKTMAGQPCVIWSSLKGVSNTSPFSSHARRELTPYQGDTQMVHDGARLILRFSDDTKSLLDDKGCVHELCQLEKSELKEDGALIEEIHHWRQAIYESSVWPRLKKAGTGQNPPLTKLRVNVVSYGVAEVIYEASIGGHSFWDYDE